MTELEADRAARARGDYAEIATIIGATGAPVEVMRTSYRTQVFPRHTHDFYTIGVILDGPGTLWHRGGAHLTYPGDVVVIAPGEVHTGAVAPGAMRLSYLAVHLPVPVLTGHCASGELDVARPIIRDAEIAGALSRIGAAALPPRRADAGGAEALAVTLGLLETRYAANRMPRGAAHETAEPLLVQQTRELLDDCYGDNVRTSLEALAAHAGVTPFHLVRVFSRAVGLSPHRYLVQTRVRHASELLARGVPCSHVAAMTGFADQSHLTTQFKRYLGITPGSYQRARGAR